MDRYAAAFPVDETGRPAGIIRVVFENHALHQYTLKIGHSESIISPLLIRMKGYEVLASCYALADPFLG